GSGGDPPNLSTSPRCRRTARPRPEVRCTPPGHVGESSRGPCWSAGLSCVLTCCGSKTAELGEEVFEQVAPVVQLAHPDRVGASREQTALDAERGGRHRSELAPVRVEHEPNRGGVA